jgi:hypothetical protein
MARLEQHRAVLVHVVQQKGARLERGDHVVQGSPAK